MREEAPSTATYGETGRINVFVPLILLLPSLLALLLAFIPALMFKLTLMTRALFGLVGTAFASKMRLYIDENEQFAG